MGSLVKSVVAAVWLAGVWTVGAEAQKAPAGWEESAGLRCVLSGEIDAGARIFDSPDYKQTLVVPEPGDEAWILALKAQTVRTLPKTAIHWGDEGLPIPEATAGQDAGGFLRQEGSMVFVVGEWTVEIQPEPPLVGALTLADLKAKKSDYDHAAVAYVPDAKAIATWKSVKGDTRVIVFFGSWCSHCKHWLPTLLKSLDVAANPKLHPEFFGVSEDMTEPAAALKQYGVSETPTFLVYQGGKEIGRIEVEPEVSVEADLARILAGR